MDFTPPRFAFIDSLGGGEMVLIFFVVLLLFGGKRLPELARGLGRSVREFKKATSGVETEIKRVFEEPLPPPRKRTPPPAAIEPLAVDDALETDPLPPPAPASASAYTKPTGDLPPPPAPEKPAS